MVLVHDGVAARLAGFVREFTPDMQELIWACRARLQELYPGAWQLVWDNYNFLVVGFSPSDRPSDAPMSLACGRRGVSLCFVKDAPSLPDPEDLLRGSGRVVRNLELTSAADLDRPAVRALVDAASLRGPVPLAEAEGGELVVRSVSAKRRARR